MWIALGPVAPRVLKTGNSSRRATAPTLAEPGWKARVVASPRLTLYVDQPGNVAVVNQRAYVRAFELSAADHVLEADPVVDVLSDGALLAVRGRPEGADAVALDLTLHLADLQELGEVEASVPGSFTPVTIQQPVLSQQRLSSDEAEYGVSHFPPPSIDTAPPSDRQRIEGGGK